MLRLLADENIDGDLIEAVRAYDARIEFLRVQDVNLGSQPDERILAWATEVQALVVTHDVQTFPGALYGRLDRGELTCGTAVVPVPYTLRRIADDLATLALASDFSDWTDQVLWLPLRPSGR